MTYENRDNLVNIELLSQGAYNKVYTLSKNEQIVGVLKLQIKDDYLPKSEAEEERMDVETKLDSVERSVRIWNEINPDLPADKYEANIDGQAKVGWTCPFIKGRQATDKEITKCLMEIYQRTGRIILDGVGRKNVLTQKDGKTICIDIGLAAKLDNDYGPLLRINSDQNSARRGSIVGINHWRSMQKDFSSYFGSASKDYPNSVQMIKALVFLNRYRPDLKNVEFLENNPLTAIIASAYDSELESPIVAIYLIEELLPEIDHQVVTFAVKQKENESEDFIQQGAFKKYLADARESEKGTANDDEDEETKLSLK